MTPDQLDLFAAAARTADPPTSHAAAAAAAPRAARQAQLVLAVVGRAGIVGATADDVAARLPASPPSSIARRLTDLARACMVADTGRRRPTRYGRDAIVWAITPAGREALDRGRGDAG